MASVELFSRTVGNAIVVAEWRKAGAPCVVTLRDRCGDWVTESIRYYRSDAAAIYAAKRKARRLARVAGAA